MTTTLHPEGPRYSHEVRYLITGGSKDVVVTAIAKFLEGWGWGYGAFVGTPVWNEARQYWEAEATRYRSCD